MPTSFAAVSDPVGNGLIKSLARPGGNITGRTNITGDLGPKRLELLLAAVPDASRVAVLVDPAIATDALAADSLQAAVRKRRVTVARLGATTPQEIEAAFATMARDFRRLATYADRIFKGAKPADLPVEQPTSYEFVINCKTAKALGLTITRELLLQADQVIE